MTCSLCLLPSQAIPAQSKVGADQILPKQQSEAERRDSATCCKNTPGTRSDKKKLANTHTVNVCVKFFQYS